MLGKSKSKLSWTTTDLKFELFKAAHFLDSSSMLQELETENRGIVIYFSLPAFYCHHKAPQFLSWLPVGKNLAWKLTSRVPGFVFKWYRFTFRFLQKAYSIQNFTQQICLIIYQGRLALIICFNMGHNCKYKDWI